MVQARTRTSALDVANYFMTLAMREPDGTANMDPLLIENLVYLAQCWSLAEGAALFEEEVEAWPEGPVVANVWKAYSGRRNVVPEEEPYCELSGDEMDLVHGVWSFYKRFTSDELSERTQRAGGAWRQARGSLANGEPARMPIPHELMAEEAQREQSGATQWLADNWERVVRAVG